jgi:hypothetical protein
MFRRLLLLFVAVLAMAPASALADCVVINADPEHKLTAIAHIDDERAEQLIAGRPWPSVRSLTGINGIGRGRKRTPYVPMCRARLRSLSCNSALGRRTSGSWARASSAT